jgi:hypothetical protein
MKRYITTQVDGWQSARYSKKYSTEHLKQIRAEILKSIIDEKNNLLDLPKKKLELEMGKIKSQYMRKQIEDSNQELLSYMKFQNKVRAFSDTDLKDFFNNFIGTPGEQLFSQYLEHEVHSVIGELRNRNMEAKADMLALSLRESNLSEPWQHNHDFKSLEKELSNVESEIQTNKFISFESEDGETEMVNLNELIA